MNTEEKIEYIKDTLRKLEAFCRESGFKCGLGFGGGVEYSGGLMEWDEENKKFNQLTEQHTVRSFSNISFRVTIKDTDYDGKHHDYIGDSCNEMAKTFRGLPNSEDFETHEP